MQPRGSGWWEGRSVCLYAALSVQLRKQDLTCFSGFTDVACGSQCTAALSHLITTLTWAFSFPNVQIWDNFPNVQTKDFYLGKHFEPPTPKYRVKGWIRQRTAFQRDTCGLKQGKNSDSKLIPKLDINMCSNLLHCILFLNTKIMERKKCLKQPL